MSPRKASYAYQPLGNPEKQVGSRNCSSISWFVIFTCSVIILFLIFLSSPIFSADDATVTYSESSENPSAEIFDAASFADQHAENSDHPSNKKPDIKNSDYTSVEKSDAGRTSMNQSTEKPDDCAGKYIQILDLSSEFNTDVLKNCSTLNIWFDMCNLIINCGLGLRLNVSDNNVFSDSGWFATDQFTLEIIFHSRMKQYKCLTNDSSKASAVYVPYYAGLDVGRYLFNPNTTLRDALSVKFAEYVKRKPEWKKMGGRDHFLALGRVAGDFVRSDSSTSDSGGGWGNQLFNIPGMRNMTSLVIEANLGSKSEVAIPYPTFFHPSSENQVHNWQEKMRGKNRAYLFSFAGAPRPDQKGSIRNEIIKQCLAAEGSHCKFMDCSSGETDCKISENVMRLFQSSDFCLQPPGDSYTRKSFFDTILSGCIPVIFHPASAYIQYLWHLPKDYSSYSVLMPMDEVKNGSLSIEKRLLEIPKQKVIEMREEVMKLIPRIVYANPNPNPNPNPNTDGLEDAFQVTVKGVLDRVATFRKEMDGGGNSSFQTVPDGRPWSWVYNYFLGLKNNEWDKYFDGSITIY